MCWCSRGGAKNIVNVNTNAKVDQKEVLKAIDSLKNNPELPASVKTMLIKKLQDKIKPVATEVVKVNADNDEQPGDTIGPTTTDANYQAYLATQEKLPEGQRDNIVLRLYNKKAFVYKAEYGIRAKEVITEQFEHNIPKMMFIMLPLCALILMVAFWNNKKYYVEYLIYTFHLHCFIFLFLSIIILMKWLIPVSSVHKCLNFLSFITITWYIYQSLKVVFERKPIRIITKMLGACLMYLLSFTICITLVFFITALLA